MKHSGLALLLILTSCATLSNQWHYDVTVSSNYSPADRLKYDNEIYELPTEISVRRSKRDLQLRLISDSTQVDYTIKPSPDPVFLYKNLLWLHASPAAYLVDLTNQKRFHYGKSIFLSAHDSLRILTPGSRSKTKGPSGNRETHKGDLDLTLSIPYVNNFYFRPEGESTKAKTGFFGLSVGMNYFYRDSKYLGITGSAAMDFLSPVPVPVHYAGEHEFTTSAYVSLTDNFRFNRVRLGYGLNFSRNTWQFKDFGQVYPDTIPVKPSLRKSGHTLGLVLNGYYQVGPHFLLGALYRPNFLSVSPRREWLYQHLITFDLAWRIGLKMRR